VAQHCTPEDESDSEELVWDPLKRNLSFLKPYHPSASKESRLLREMREFETGEESNESHSGSSDSGLLARRRRRREIFQLIRRSGEVDDDDDNESIGSDGIADSEDEVEDCDDESFDELSAGASESDQLESERNSDGASYQSELEQSCVTSTHSHEDELTSRITADSHVKQTSSHEQTQLNLNSSDASDSTTGKPLLEFLVEKVNIQILLLQGDQLTMACSSNLVASYLAVSLQIILISYWFCVLTSPDSDRRLPEGSEGV
jgi:hypothetical protein